MAGRILVVDDEPDIRELVRLNLEIEGYDVVLAPTGNAALATLEAEPIDLVLLDVMMPGIDGWEVLSRIKGNRDPRLSEVPVVMLTARADDLDRIRGGIEGAVRYITKPFGVTELNDIVREALEGEPEPVQRRHAQNAALERLARIEKGDAAEGAPVPRPRLTRFEQQAMPSPGLPRQKATAIDTSHLSAKQVELLAAVSRTRTVRDAADQLAVSRSNVYASLRRIARKLDMHSVPELVMLARSGTFQLD